eukprot:CAMPEP_0168343974 /NCGR_PEP_ID=MMETSP0213-20121227/16496_1 /TAXON_ID=151035 /ORGANISM="Euplotes harpa, Strain FSP1.4" /LENGTH=78 /DNA_ID=CAMNT_0008351539 /DNA_START=359 /DNA_END=595 /DNA_ORIENTATION=+
MATLWAKHFIAIFNRFIPFFLQVFILIALEMRQHAVGAFELFNFRASIELLVLGSLEGVKTNRAAGLFALLLLTVEEV